MYNNFNLKKNKLLMRNEKEHKYLKIDKNGTGTCSVFSDPYEHEKFSVKESHLEGKQFN